MRKIVRLSPSALLAVLVSTTLVCLIALANVAIRTGMGESVRTAISGADLVATPSRGQTVIPPTIRERVGGVPGVTRVEGHVSEVVVVTSMDGMAMGVQSLPAEGQLTVTQGRLPSKASEVVLVPVASKSVNVGLGTRLETQGSGRGTRPVTVVGLATAPVGIVDRPSTPTLLTTDEGAQALAGRPGHQRLHISTSGSASEVMARLSAQPGVASAIQLDRGPDYVSGHLSDFTPGARTIMTAMRALGFIALVAALVVIMNTFSIKAAQRSRQLALLRCLGATRRQIFGLVMVEALATGLMGALGGILLAHLLALPLLGRLSVGLPIRFHFSWTAILVALLAGLLATILAAVGPARRSTRISPMEALRNPVPAATPRSSRVRGVLGLTAVGLGLLMVLVAATQVQDAVIAAAGGLLCTIGMVVAAPTIFPVVAAWFGRLGGAGASAAVQNLRRNPRRTGAVSVAVWFGTMLIATVMAAAATASSTLVNAVDESTPADVMVDSSAEPASLAGQLAALPDVAAARPVSAVMVTATIGAGQPLTVVPWSEGLSNVVLDPAGVPEPAAGSIQLPPSPGLSDGQQLTLTRQSTTISVTVRIVKGAPGVGLMTAQDFQPLQKAALPSVWVKLRPDAQGDSAMAQIVELAGPTATVSSPIAERAEITSTLRRATIATNALLAVVVLITLIGVSNTLSLSVIERTREFGLLRALGALRRQVTRTVLTEAVLTTSTATVLGALFGLIFGVGGAGALLTGEQLQLVPAVPWLQLLGVILLSIPVALLAAVVPARNAARTAPIVALVGAGE